MQEIYTKSVLVEIPPLDIPTSLGILTEATYAAMRALCRGRIVKFEHNPSDATSNKTLKQLIDFCDSDDIFYHYQKIDIHWFFNAHEDVVEVKCD